jgi:hypothetical protein
MTNLLNCVKFTLVDGTDIWLLSILDKMFGEIQGLSGIRKAAQNLELDVNFLIYDVVSANEELLDNLLSDRLANIDNDNDKQLIKESFVRELINTGNFGHKVFSKFLERVEDLITSTNRTDRVIDTVTIGLRYRFIKGTVQDLGNRKGYVYNDKIKNGEVKIGLAEPEIKDILWGYNFGEKNLNDIFEFLSCEYANVDYFSEFETDTQKELENLKEPELLGQDNDGEETEQKKPVLL